jgi:hypothetical protein
MDFLERSVELTFSPERSVEEDQFAVACEGKLTFFLHFFTLVPKKLLLTLAVPPPIFLTFLRFTFKYLFLLLFFFF